MSEVYDPYSRHGVYAGLTIEVTENCLDHVMKLLAGIPGGAYKAVGSALKRAASTGKTVAKRSVTGEYFITQSQFLSCTRNINHFERETSGELSVAFGFAGYVIPLLKFNTRVEKNGLITTQVKRSSSPESLRNAFTATMGGHFGVYERIGKERFPIKQLFGPSTPQMMYSNEKVLDEMDKKMSETVEKRIEHEITRILNGWGTKK